MSALGLNVPRKDADGLFDTFDPDGGGSIDYKELQKALKRRVALDPSLQPGAVKIELTAKNKSTREKVQTAGGKVVAANRIKGEKGAALNSEVPLSPLYLPYISPVSPLYLQAANVLLDEHLHVKLADFGISTGS